MLREAAQVDQYNFRNYAIRRVREDFRRNAALSGSEAATALQEGKDALEVLRRQRAEPGAVSKGCAAGFRPPARRTLSTMNDTLQNASVSLQRQLRVGS